MIRHFNYTNRQRIPQEQLQFVWKNGDDGFLRFNAVLDLSLPTPLPPDAVVVVEAYSGPVIMRFPFGTVGAPQHPEDTALRDFPPGLKPSFRVKVVETAGASKKLLAWARDIAALTPDDAEAGRRSILPVESVDLGPMVWDVRFENNSPVLQVNSCITQPRHITVMAKEADFLALVYPAAIHRILIHLLLGPSADDVNREHEWLRFGFVLARRPAPDREDFPDADEAFREEVDDWIKEVVRGFCQRQSSVENYIQFRKEAEKYEPA